MELALPFLVFGAVLALIVLAMFVPRPLMAVLLAGSGALMIFQARGQARPSGVGLLIMGLALIAVAAVVAVQ